MAVKTRILRLQSLVAYLQSEKNGDEIFIRYKGKKIAPADEKYYKMTEAPVEIKVELKLGKEDKWVELELWEYDALFPNVRLGNFKLLVDQHSDTFTAELNRENTSSAKYVLNWELITRLNDGKKTTSPLAKKG